MGKLRRQRTLFHTSPKKNQAKEPQATTSATTKPEADEVDHSIDSLNTTPISFTVPDNLFANVNINLSSLKKSLNDNDDTHSVKSTTSTKSNNKSKVKVLNKKDKLKLRREQLLKKIDTVNQLKKETRLRNKRKKTSIIGDTNPLHDALPSLESLLKKTDKSSGHEPKKAKGIQKATKRKKETIKNIQLYKSISKNKKFNANPLSAITQHVRAIVEEDKLKNEQKK